MMKLVEHFGSFLDETVNLNETRLNQLQTSVGALKDVIRDSDWSPSKRSFIEQGSWAHGTIIKPVEGKPFDADLLVIVDPVAGWDARQYLSTLRTVFASHGTYVDKVRRFSHCITIEYAGERKVDLAPCIRNRNGTIGHEVCNYDSNEFERSAPEAYTNWLRDRNGWTGSNGLKKVTRLLKYLRDIKGNFSCPSILLTTLLGMQITQLDAALIEPFTDVPTALKTIVNRLDDWLQARPSKPLVANPVLSTECFSDLWTDEQYSNFREKISLYRSWIDDAFNETDRDESIGKWRRVFGEEFASQVTIDKAASVTTEARQLVLRARGQLAPHEDLVGLLSRLGPWVLPPGFEKLPHKQRPPWPISRFGGFSLVVGASLHTNEKGVRITDVTSGTGPLKKGQWLRFAVREASGSMFGEDKYKVYWRITNTDQEAYDARCLRGGFERANEGTSHWERLGYRGVHMAEAFVVRRNDNALVGQSSPFYVVVG